MWCGVGLDTPNGRNDGSMRGKSYFASRPGHGIFSRPQNITHGIFLAQYPYPLEDGEYSIDIQLNNKPINGSPLTPISKCPLNPEACEAKGPGLDPEIWKRPGMDPNICSVFTVK